MAHGRATIDQSAVSGTTLGMAKVRVPIWNSPGKYATIDTDPARGTTLGVDLYYNGRLLDPREILNSYGGGSTVISVSGGGSSSGPGSSIRTTDELDEGRWNWYFTVERAQDAIGAALANSLNVTLTYDDGANTITADLTKTGVVAGTYGDATHYPVVTVDGRGRVTAASVRASSGGIPEAPIDGKTYGRKDGAWAQMSGGGKGAVGASLGPPLGETGIVLPSRVITIPLPSGYVFTGWRILCNPAASVQVDVRYIPTLGMPSAGDSITPARLSTTASGSASGNTSAWTTASVANGGTLAIALTSNDAAVSVVVSLDGDKA